MNVRARAMRPTSVTILAVALCVGWPATAGASGPAGPPDQVRLVSESLGGGPGDDDSVAPSMSRDGRLVVFSSRASDLVEGDHNGAYDVFLLDRVTDTITRVNKALDGSDADGDSFGAVISPDGSTVVFGSLATNLVEEDINDEVQLYHLDLATGQTTLVTQDADGQPGNGPSQSPAVSDDGRFVAYSTDASNLINGDDNGQTDVLVWDARRDRTRLVSATPDGDVGNGPSQSPSITEDAKIIAFDSYATNLTEHVDTNQTADVFVSRDGLVDMITIDDGDRAVGGNGAVLGPDGGHVAYSTAFAYARRDDNGTTDLYLRNAATGRTRVLSVTPDGAAAGAAGQVEDISANARSVTFSSWADDLVAGDDNQSPDVFVRNRGHDVALVGKRPDGTPGDLGSTGSSLDRRGKVIAFGSASTDLGPPDPGPTSDVFLYRQPKDR